MGFIKRKYVIAIVTVIVSVILVFAVGFEYWMQVYQIHKITFIIQDNQHENNASLTKERLARYLTDCGAKVDSTGSTWIVDYNHLLFHKHWEIHFSEPISESKDVLPHYP